MTPPTTQGSIEALPSSLAAEAAWNEASRAKKAGVDVGAPKAKAKPAKPKAK